MPADSEMKNLRFTNQLKKLIAILPGADVVLEATLLNIDGLVGTIPNLVKKLRTAPSFTFFRQTQGNDQIDSSRRQAMACTKHDVFFAY